MRPIHQPPVQRWLQQHCESSPQILGGLVLAAGADGGVGTARLQVVAGSNVQPQALPLAQPLTVAEWPANGDMTPPLAAAAQAALQRGRPVVVAPSVALPNCLHNRVLALPIRQTFGNHEAVGAVALAVRADDAAAVERLFKELEAASAGVGHSLRTSTGVAPSGDTNPNAADGDAARVLHLQHSLLEHATVAEGALALVTELASLLGCERLTLAALQGGALNVLAISGSAEFKSQQDLVHLTLAAMQEAADQGTRVVYPAPPTEPARIVLAHAELHARYGHAVASVPLVHAQQVVGALLAEWRGADPAGAAQLDLLGSVASVTGPWLALAQRAERSTLQRCGDTLRGAWQRLLRPGDPLPKIGLALVVMGLAAALWLPIPYRVAAPARIEGAVQRVLAAPMDGFLHKAHVRPGDSVKAGDTLVELADQDLVLEQRKWEGALAQHENSFAAALARADRAQFVISQGKAQEARSQLDLVRQQLARTKLLAPIDGVVIKGDLSQALGAPVQRGDALLTLAPAERFRLIVEVDERDINSVLPGQQGQLALASVPGERLGFAVERVTPVATLKDGHNSFEIEARLNEAAPQLRPGLLGVAKIDAGERSAAWIFSHRSIDWLRLAWWRWGT